MGGSFYLQPLLTAGDFASPPFLLIAYNVLAGHHAHILPPPASTSNFLQKNAKIPVGASVVAGFVIAAKIELELLQLHWQANDRQSVESPLIE